MRPSAHAESKHRRKPSSDIVDDRVVMTRMTPWSPAQGPGSDAPLNASGDDGVFRIDTSVEGPWSRVICRGTKLRSCRSSTVCAVSRRTP